jgi:hypothetical protein
LGLPKSKRNWAMTGSTADLPCIYLERMLQIFVL